MEVTCDIVYSCRICIFNITQCTRLPIYSLCLLIPASKMYMDPACLLNYGYHDCCLLVQLLPTRTSYIPGCKINVYNLAETVSTFTKQFPRYAETGQHPLGYKMCPVTRMGRWARVRNHLLSSPRSTSLCDSRYEI